MKIFRALVDPRPGDLERIGHDDLLAPRNAADELYDPVVQHIDRRDYLHRQSSANAMKFFRNLIPDLLLFSGWN